MKDDIGDNTFWLLTWFFLFSAITVIALSTTDWSFAAERYGLEHGYCQAQNLGDSGYRWVKCSDPR